MTATSGFALAVDIGGTFTDVVLRHEGGASVTDKTLTTHRNLLEGFFRAVELALDRAGIGPAAVTAVTVHATTLVTNAVIERRGPPTALLATRGFRDVLSIRNEHRYDMFDPQIEFPDPLVPDALVYTLDERTHADGSVAKPVDAAEASALARRMQADGVQAVGICLLNAYRNGANEQAARTAILAAAPGMAVTLSSEVSPQIREYPRASTTVMNAYTQPIVAPYLAALEAELARRGFPNRPLIMLSNGGVVGTRVAGGFPVRMIESGPAAGALAAAHFSAVLDLPRLLSFDMGGTTAKACLIEGGRPLVAGEFEVDRRYRFKPGSGFPITIPAVDMIEIGAGGGSIARVDTLGLLKVGPRSAGSEPGPVCYGRGGTQPTVTDADVVLGLLDADRFLGGDMKLDRAGAEAALGALGAQLGTDAVTTARGVFEVVCEQMAGAARAHATDRGLDWRGLPMLAFGGAGPVHACRVAELLECSRLVFPPMASVLSAFGTLVSPVRLDLVRSALAPLAALDWAATRALVQGMETEGRAALAEAGVRAAEAMLELAVDCRYRGQQNEVTADLPLAVLAAGDAPALRAAFEAAYQALYGLTLPDVPLEVVTWRLAARGPIPEASPPPATGGVPAAPRTHRRVAVEAAGPEVPVFDRATLAVGQRIAGPAIIEERETTLVVLRGWTACVHATGAVVAERAA
ncbi:hydantoinase/oxoprolinase family protein [Roseomonas sp. BU-1]|uniref:Hydantoinase/oxoprolinase family protein n=1 Tax=Falsiroseomonas selenitidurans TaxID=2716335 RepID=A0ABX1E5J1_9PROT|nr:hydantoinase/oxoprolinase family protein [Falsiroseomonas selenitidurans]